MFATRTAFLRNAVAKRTTRNVVRRLATPAWNQHHGGVRPSFDISAYTVGGAALATAVILFAPSLDWDDPNCMDYCNNVVCEGNCDHELLPGHEYQ
jgi:hypothetical protein